MKKKYKNQMRNSKDNTKNSERNGKNRANNSPTMTFKTKSTEQQLNKLGTTSTKD